MAVNGVLMSWPYQWPFCPPNGQGTSTELLMLHVNISATSPCGGLHFNHLTRFHNLIGLC